MPIVIGQTVRVKTGQQDKDTGISLGGWSGQVIDSHPESGMIEIEWDSPTLSQMPDAYIRHSIDGCYDYFRYHMEAVNVEVIDPKDTPFEVKEVQKALEAHYRDYELHGRRPLPFSAAEGEANTGFNPEAISRVKKEFLALLKTIQGSGSFVTSGIRPFTHPGLHIAGIGEIGLPVTASLAKDIIDHAKRAPFGKGRKTITDTSVRRAWEIDPRQVSFQNKDWDNAIQDIIKTVKQGLGIESQRVSASLYKLLVYEEGDFFLPHKDSEKEKGMFATLVVGLPSSHSGGELIIRFDGREETVDFAPAASSYRIPFAAFYADCEHEIKPVTSGYRVCLVYNLVQSAGSPKISSPKFGHQVSQMADLLRSAETYFEWRPQTVLLGHQYTPANFSLAQLKLHDRPRAEALMEAAEKAGYFSSLALVTLYRMGALEDSDDYYFKPRNRRYDKEEESGRGTMGEVYEEYTTIEHWAAEDTPGLGELNIREEDILTEIKMGEEEPIEQEEEGYTGNAGMTMQYWYHYGAVILWPESRHGMILSSAPVPVRLQWLAYYLRHWNDADLNSREYAMLLLTSIEEDANPEERGYRSADFSVVATALGQLEDERFLKQHGEALLSAVFDKITVENWLDLLQRYRPDAFRPLFQKAAERADIFVIRHLLDILRGLEALDPAPLVPFVLEQIRNLPDYLDSRQLHNMEEESNFYYGGGPQSRKEAITAIIENILALSFHAEKDAGWVKNVLERLSSFLPGKYVNEVLVPILLSRKFSQNALAKALYEVCLQDLKARTAVKPSPPPDWSRTVPESRNYQEIWEFLAPFLRSPTQQVFDYQANQSYRTEMERAVKSVKIDLKMETIKKGSPHTLRLTKTQAAYERKLKIWEDDMALLEQLGKYK